MKARRNIWLFVSAYDIDSTVFRIAEGLSVDKDVMIFHRDVNRFITHAERSLSAVSDADSPYYGDRVSDMDTLTLAQIMRNEAKSMRVRLDRLSGVENFLWERFAEIVKTYDASQGTTYYDALFRSELRSVPKIGRYT